MKGQKGLCKGLTFYGSLAFKVIELEETAMCLLRDSKIVQQPYKGLDQGSKHPASTLACTSPNIC